MYYRSGFSQDNINLCNGLIWSIPKDALCFVKQTVLTLPSTPLLIRASGFVPSRGVSACVSEPACKIVWRHLLHNVSSSQWDSWTQMWGAVINARRCKNCFRARAHTVKGVCFSFATHLSSCFSEPWEAGELQQPVRCYFKLPYENVYPKIQLYIVRKIHAYIFKAYVQNQS